MVTIQRAQKLTYMTKVAAVIGSVILLGSTSYAQVVDSPSSLEPSGYITDTAPQFTWSTVSNAESYEFQLTDESDSVVYLDQAGLDGPPFQIVGAVYDQAKAYHWKVRGADSNGNPGPWSAISAFLIYDPSLTPQVTAPAGYITTVTPLFTWNSIDSAATYDLWVTDESETTTIVMLGGLTQNSYQQPANMPFSPYMIYHYRIRSHTNAGASSIWSDPGSFMMYISSDIPTLVSPNIQSSLQHTAFSWTPSTNAATYELMVMSADETVIILDASGISDTSFAMPAGLPVSAGEVYHWKVRAHLVSGNNSLWSSVFSFGFYDQNSVPDALSPIGYITSSTVTLEWTQVSNATAYNIQIVDPNTYNILLATTVTGDTRLFLNSYMKIAKNTAYNWRVQAVVVGGSSAIWSDMRSFKVTGTAWAGRIANLKFKTSYSLSGSSSTLSWQTLNLAGMGTLSYRAVLRTEPAKGSPATTVWSGFSDASTPSQVALPSSVILLPATNYAWIVQAFTSDNSLIGESNHYNFTTPNALSSTALAQIASLQSSQTDEVTSLQAQHLAAVVALNKSLPSNKKLTASQKAAKLSDLNANQIKSMNALLARQASKLQHLLNQLERAAKVKK